MRSLVLAIVGLSLVALAQEACTKPPTCPTGYYRQGNRCYPLPPPPPPPPPVTQVCPDGSIIPATEVCPAPPPPPSSGELTPGGYAQLKNWPCCNGRIVRLEAAPDGDYGWVNTRTDIAPPPARRIWAAHFLEDRASTNLDDGGVARTVFFWSEDLEPIPAPQ